MPDLTHFAADGSARMVDVHHKPETVRTATASALVTMLPATLARVQSGDSKKGDVLGVARLAGILAAKRTDELIPLCHSLPLSSVVVEFEVRSETVLKITATTTVSGRTGVEMESLVAVSIAALTVYDMVKSADRGVSIGPVRLEAKSGGQSGDFASPSPPA